MSELEDKIKSYIRSLAIITGFVIISFAVNGLNSVSREYNHGFYQSSQFALVMESVLDDIKVIVGADVSKEEVKTKEEEKTDNQLTEATDQAELNPSEWKAGARNLDPSSFAVKDRAAIKEAIANLDSMLNMSIYAENITDGIIYKSSIFQPEYIEEHSSLNIVISSDEEHNSSGLRYLENAILEQRVYLADKNKEHRIVIVIRDQPENFLYEDNISAAYSSFLYKLRDEAIAYGGIFLLGAVMVVINLRQFKKTRLKKINYRNPTIEEKGMVVLDEISKALKYVKLEFKAVAFFIVISQLSYAFENFNFFYYLKSNVISLIVGAVLIYDFAKSDKEEYMKDSYFNKFINRNKLFPKKKRAGTINSVSREFDENFDIIFIIGGLIILSFLMSLVGNNEGLYILSSLAGGVIILVQAFRIRNRLIDERLAYVDEIAEKVQDIVDGKMDQVLEERSGYPMEELAHNINLMREGYGTALQEQLKSEKMKTELITNVSHDLKTPLTSIINYVDLLKKEDILPEYARDYVAILDKKSQRLNALIQDLFEVSKAASGDLDINMEKLDISELLHQSLAELSPQIDGSGLDFVTDIPREEILALADGEKLHRVFENLITNILKYTMAGTRVYVDMQVNDKITITMKNISNYKMNFSKEDITQRFTRADEARSSEGSGLGLAITKSLLDLMNMNMNIITDGDLFKVEIVILC